MDAKQIQALVEETIKRALGMTPDEFRKEKQKQKEEDEAHNQSTRKIIFEMEMSQTSDDYFKKAKHITSADPLEGVGLPLARCIRAIAGAKKSNMQPHDYALKLWGDRWLADDLKKAQENSFTEQKILATDSESAGGFIVPPEYRNSMIELLRTRTIVRRAGIPVVPMRKGSMTLPKQTSSADAGYVGEARRIDPSEPAFGQIQLLARKLAGIVPVSNDLLRESDPSADMIVRDDLTRVMAIEEDAALLRGQGTQFTPQGLRYWINTNNVFNSAGTSLDQKTDDLFDAILQVEESEVDLFNAVWFLSVRTESNLRRTRDANGNFAFKGEMDNGMLLGWPFFKSTQVPTNLSGTNSEIYFVETSQCIIGDTLDLELIVEPNGTYTTAAGTVVSGLSHDLTVVRAIKKHDFAMRHDVAGAVVQAVAY